MRSEDWKSYYASQQSALGNYAHQQMGLLGGIGVGAINCTHMYCPTSLTTEEEMQLDVNDWLKDWDK